MTKDHDDDPTPHPKGPMIPGKDGLTLDQMNLLRGMIQTGKLKVDPPSGLTDLLKTDDKE